MTNGLPSAGMEAEQAEDTFETEPPSRSGQQDAFSELMRPKPKPSPKKIAHSHRSLPMFNPHDSRDGLYPYIKSPESQPPEMVIYHTPSFVLVNDLFPKATVHLLLLPRDQSRTRLDPRIALSTDPAYLAACRAEAAKATSLAAKELARRIGQKSKTEAARLHAMESDQPPEPLPPGRDWLASIRAGIHAHPSMSHLHIHILSTDMHSDCMKHRKHYNSFNTDFFIPLDAFPLAKDDPRWQIPHQNANLKEDFKCWRCGRDFGNKFAKLKEHLEDEFAEWAEE